MSDCCTSAECSTKRPRRLECPRNGADYVAVEVKTIMQHLKHPWQYPLKEQGYYFCGDPDCDVVYFGEDGAVINQTELRTTVGQKQTDDQRMLCYCFGVTLDVYSANPEIKKFITEQTKAGLCSCDVRNPSGRCCLKDFPR